MLSESIEKDLNSFADTIGVFVDKALSEEGQKQALGKVTHILDVASQLIDHIDSENDRDKQQPDSNINGKSVLETLQLLFQAALTKPDVLAKHYCEFATSVLDVLSQQSELEPEPADRRFKDDLWHESIFLNSLMKIYLAWDQQINSWISEQSFSSADERRVQFIFNQIIYAFSPSNLPVNPSALKRAEKTEGRSAVKGLLNWVKDSCFNQSMPRQIRDDAFKVGKNLATTPGQVVFRNKLLELIQYQPQTPYVHRRPVLLVPPQINKYYIFDLKQKNSVLGYLLKQNLQMFVISWRNPGKSESHWGLDEYVVALLEAIEVMRVITKSRTVGLISACAGCLTTSALLGYLAETKNPVIKNHTSLVTALTPDNDSILELFTTQQTLKLARAHTQIEGILDGKALARVFAWLRPEDLVWNYWVNNYLMGRDPPTLDVLYWDNDSTNLPAKLHGDFLDMFEQDVFQNAHLHKVLGIPIDYRKVCVDTYVIAGREDYLMPWKGVYKTTRIFRGKHRFVLSTSGHVQSVLRPPSLAHTEYYTNETLCESADEWLESSTRQDGTWWVDWTSWLKKQSGALKKSPQKLGAKNFPPLCNAPGRYVCDEK
ncbi:MAG: class II poly(R)-hydroxyalkanoic acid synthase [endosymbiont of Galathealinum brachiosum]|uniref:Class II poly(R)-hydroxyalkanoic acid synthase n=1 Tax=endosymbiont of Galathealinum brachiosum TaxID=2200906 RepID=A0A370DHT3_9GAMM|nr:MAG: class II poly(R)-hydroxyalkanoic acid synthase [endosymbiont of Galathealinum brachiosum]